MPEVSIQFLMGMKVASLEKEGPVAEVGAALEQLSQFLKEKNVKVTGTAMGLFHDDPKAFNPQKARYEVCFPISGKFKEERGFKVKELGKAAFACITHSGPIGKIPEAYQAALKWIGENGYQVSGPIREIYQRGIGGAQGGAQDCLIDIQFPVKR